MTGGKTGKLLRYDAWNRLIEVKQGMRSLASYVYDAFYRRVKETAPLTTDLYFSSNWQVLEEREGSMISRQYIRSPVSIDSLVHRDRDADGNGSLEERLYVRQDANFNVVAIQGTYSSLNLNETRNSVRWARISARPSRRRNRLPTRPKVLA